LLFSVKVPIQDMASVEARVLSAGKVVLINDQSTEDRTEAYKKKVTGKLLVFEQGHPLHGVTPSSVDVVISHASDPSVHTIEVLSSIMPLLKSNGLLVIYEPLQGRDFGVSTDLSSRLLLVGYTDTKVASKGDMVEVSSMKPEWEMGASHKVGIKNQARTWSLSSSEVTDVIDEDSLLNEEDRYVKPTTTRDDCEVGAAGKKACKNCTCGRAEEEDGASQKKKLTLDMLENPGVNSSCGSCGLGDAFRCSGCPYRGLPAFKVGEKITLAASFLEDDI